MMQYQYVAYTPERKLVRGVLVATSPANVEEALRLRGWRLLSLSRKTSGIDLTKLFPSLFNVKAKDIIDFSKQLALLLECGINLSVALKLLHANLSNRLLRRVVGEVGVELSHGSQLSQALAKYSSVFGDLYVRMVAVGERTGNLESSLREVVAYMEKHQATSRKVTKALTYPAIVLVMAVAVALLMTTVVLPQMTRLLSSLKMELPLPTRLLLGFSSFVTSNQAEIIAGVSALALAGIVLYMRPGTRVAFQRMMLAVPLLGRAVLMAELAKFSRTTSMLLHAGISLPDAVEMVSRSTRNQVISRAIVALRSELLRGRSLATAMKSQRVFTPALVQMVAVGEETGKLESTLSTIAQAYEIEADERMTALIAFIEPAMTLFVAVVVGFIALAVIMPMYSIIGSLG